MKIVVLDDYQRAFSKVSDYPRLKDHEVVVYNDTEKDPAKLAVRLKDADAVVLTQERSLFPRTVIEKLPKLRLIAQTGSHKHHIDIAACTAQGIVIAISDGGPSSSRSTAEHTWALILANVRHLPNEIEQLKRGVWQNTAGTQLYGKTLGIYALGQIGSWVAEVGKAFGMNVMCWGREASLAKARAAGYEVAPSREAFFESADIVSLHIFYSPETRGIITAGDLARMKTTALLVNTSRARLIQEGALVEAMKQGRPGYAAVDVYEDEPVIGGNHPLLKMPNVICTPHLGYAVQEKYEDFYSRVIDNILAFASGKPVKMLNPEVIPKR